MIALRKQRRIYHRIAAEVGVSKATVGRILTRHRLNRWRDLDPAEPVRRYERARPGEMIHIDIKKLGRFNQVGHRINGDRTGPRADPTGAGNRSRLHRRPLPPRLRRHPAKREKKTVPSPS